MIADLSPYLIYELGSMKGHSVSICRYSLHDSEQTDGYAIIGAQFVFFIRVKTKYIIDQIPIHYLDITAFHQSELGDAVSFETILVGELNEVQILKHTVKGMIVNGKVIQDITTECGIVFSFTDGVQCMIYPKEQLFTHTALVTEIDDVLDEMYTNRLECSRLASKDISLLLCEQ